MSKLKRHTKGDFPKDFWNYDNVHPITGFDIKDNLNNDEEKEIRKYFKAAVKEPKN